MSRHPPNALLALVLKVRIQVILHSPPLSVLLCNISITSQKVFENIVKYSHIQQFSWIILRFTIFKNFSGCPDLKRLFISPQISASFSGGGDRIRTDDPMLAEHVLSQLSYTPSGAFPCSLLVEVNGFEPMTSCLQSMRSPN